MTNIAISKTNKEKHLMKILHLSAVQSWGGSDSSRTAEIQFLTRPTIILGLEKTRGLAI